MPQRLGFDLHQGKGHLLLCRKTQACFGLPRRSLISCSRVLPEIGAFMACTSFPQLRKLARAMRFLTQVKDAVRTA
jgi:hypothetical protein